MAYFANAVFDAECETCPLGEEPCPIAGAQFAYNYDACNVPEARAILDALVADDGTCAMKPLILGLAKRLGPDAGQAWRESVTSARSREGSGVDVRALALCAGIGGLERGVAGAYPSAW